MAATNWTIIRKMKNNGEMYTNELIGKWTYKTALAIAIESSTDDYELVCVVETSKIMLKDDKKEIQKDELPIG